MVQMVIATVKLRKTVNWVLIDTYSTQNFYYAVSIAFLCRLLKVRYIPLLHGGNLPERLRNNPALSRNLFGKAFINVAPSKYLMRKFEEAGFQNLIYIPNTIEFEKYSFLLRESLEPKLLWVRSFSEIYNPLLALEIVELLKKTGSNVSLCMIGPDKDGTLQRCKQVAEQLALPITFTGMMKPEEWRKRSREFDIFINTSNFDNMPVSVMEAMALGLPVISTDVGGMPFLIKDGTDGILVTPNNPANFVTEIEKLIDSPLLAGNLATNARAKISEFDWEMIKHNWITLLND